MYEEKMDTVHCCGNDVFIFVAPGLFAGGESEPVKESADTRFERGKEFFEQEKRQAALSEYTKAIELNPNFAAAYSERAVTLMNLFVV